MKRKYLYERNEQGCLLPSIVTRILIAASKSPVPGNGNCRGFAPGRREKIQKSNCMVKKFEGSYMEIKHDSVNSKISLNIILDRVIEMTEDICRWFSP